MGSTAITQRSSDECTMDSARFKECMFYLNMYASHAHAVSFLVKHISWSRACKLIIDRVSVQLVHLIASFTFRMNSHPCPSFFPSLPAHSLSPLPPSLPLSILPSTLPLIPSSLPTRTAPVKCLWRTCGFQSSSRGKLRRSWQA